MLTLTTKQASGISGNVTTCFGEINRLPGFVWAAIYIQIVLWVGLVGVVSTVQLFGAKMEKRSEGILHKSDP